MQFDLLLTCHPSARSRDNISFGELMHLELLSVLTSLARLARFSYGPLHSLPPLTSNTNPFSPNHVSFSHSDSPAWSKTKAEPDAQSKFRSQATIIDTSYSTDLYLSLNSLLHHPATYAHQLLDSNRLRHHQLPLRKHDLFHSRQKTLLTYPDPRPRSPSQPAQCLPRTRHLRSPGTVTNGEKFFAFMPNTA